nr:hypothetical protein [Tanacetum cinerariifolium]
MKRCGTISQLTLPYTPQHNGVSEWRNRTLLDMVQSMINLTTLPKSFWGYALESAARILNMVPTKKVEKTSYEIWHGKAPKLSYLMVWGSSGGHGLLEASGSDAGLELIQEDDTQPSKNTSKRQEEVKPTEVEPHSVDVPIRRPGRTSQAPDIYSFYVDVEEHELRDLNEPPDYKATLSDPESDKWLNVMNMEMQSMKDNQVWCLVDPPHNGQPVRSNWLFKKKTDMDGNVQTFKACLLAKGFTQTYVVDYGETFSPIVDIRAIKILLAIVVFYDYDIWQMDVKTSFLNGHLSEDSCLCKCFSMKDLGEAAYILGIKITRLIALSQSAYFDTILKKFKMENSKRGSVPIQEKLDYKKFQGAKTPSEVKRMQRVPYASAIGSIMYAVRCTRLDVAFAQNLCSRFQHNPGEIHWTVVKTILKYLRNTKDMVLVYEGRPETKLKVTCYANTGFQTDKEDTKSQPGYVFVLNGGAVD